MRYLTQMHFAICTNTLSNLDKYIFRPAEGVGSPKLLLLTGGSGVVRLRGQAKSMYSAVEMVAGIALIMARNGHIWAIRSPN